MANEFKVKKGLIVDGSGTVVDIQGTAGQLFSVTDSLTEDLFSVSDVSGTPIFNVNSSGLSTFDGDVSFGDGDKLYLGESNDLEIYHDGTHSYIDGTTTGDLYVRSTNDDVVIQGADDVFIYTQGGEDAIIATGNAGVTLYYNNASQAATISDGFTVPPTKGVYFDGGAHTYIKETSSDVLKIFVGSSGEHVAFSGGNTSFSGNVTANSGTSHSFLTGNTNNLSSADTTGFRLHQSSYTDGRYTHRFRKRDESGGVPLYLDFSSGTANVFSNLVRFGKYSGEVHDVEVNGNIKATFANTTGYQIAGTYIVDSSRNLVNINNGSFGGDVTVTGNFTRSNRLSISGDVNVIGATDLTIPQTRKLRFDGAGGHTYISEAADSNLKFYVAGTEVANFTNDNINFQKNVSINTSTTPRFQLDLAKLNNASQTDYLALGVNNGPSAGGGTAYGTGLVWKANYTGYTKRSAGIVQTAEGNYFRSGLAFFTNNQESTSSDWVERMRLNMDGKLTLDPVAGVATDGTVLDVQGSEGQLFSVNNSLTGDLFSVADVSGIPILSVKDNGYVCVEDSMLLKGAIYHNNNPQASTSIYDTQSFFGFKQPNATTSDIFFYVDGMTRMEVTEHGVELMDELKTHKIIPDSDSTHDIGTNTVRYRNIYADTLYGDGSNLSGVGGTDNTKLPLAGGTMSGDINLGAAVNASIQKTAGGGNGNFAAVELFSSGTADSGAAIAIQQQTNEGDTIIFADYEPHVEWGISAENGANEIHFTAGSSTGSLGTKTFRNNSGNTRTAYKKVIIDLAGANVSIGNTLSVAGTCSFLTNGNGSADFNYINGSEGCKIEANDATVSTFRVDSDRWRVWMGGSGNSQETLTVTEAGRVGVKKSNPAYPLDVTGTIRATSDVIAFSDERVKENIKTIDNALDKVTKLRGVNYNRKDIEDKSTKIGVIAQEIEKIIPEVVTTDDEGMKSVSYGNVVGVLIEAIKELKSEVEQLKKQIK